MTGRDSRREECATLINHEFRKLQLEKRLATMSVFDLIDYCTILFEKLKSNATSTKGLLSYIRAYLVFNYFINTFIMVHFNGFAQFMENSHLDFIIYLNLYDLFRSKDIFDDGDFAVPLEQVRNYVVQYLDSKDLLNFDVSLLFSWLDEYIEFLKREDLPEMPDDASPKKTLTSLKGARLLSSYVNKSQSLLTEVAPLAPKPSDSKNALEKRLPNDSNFEDDEIFDFNSKFPDISAPYPVSNGDKATHGAEIQSLASENPRQPRSNATRAFASSDLINIPQDATSRAGHEDYASRRPPIPVPNNGVYSMPLDVSLSRGSEHEFHFGLLPTHHQNSRDHQSPHQHLRSPNLKYHQGASAQPRHSSQYRNENHDQNASNGHGIGHGYLNGHHIGPLNGFSQNTMPQAPSDGFYQDPRFPYAPSMGNEVNGHIYRHQPYSDVHIPRQDQRPLEQDLQFGYNNQFAAPQHHNYPYHQNAPQGYRNLQVLRTQHATQHIVQPNRNGAKAQLREHGICGLRNLGSSCYINSTVQMLFGLQHMHLLFLFNDSPQLRHAMRRNQPNLTETMQNLLATFTARGGTSVVPSRFLKAVGSLKPDLNVPFEQQDAQEFLLFVLDKLHLELAVKAQNVDPRTFVNDADVHPTDREEYTKWCKNLAELEGISAVNDMVQGHVQSKLVCNKCNHRSCSYSLFSILSLPIPSSNGRPVDLTDCLRYFTQDEVLSGENAWNCPECNKSGSRDNPMDVVFQEKKGLFRLPKRSKSPAKKASTVPALTNISIKQLSFVKLPPALFIHLSRFSMVNLTDKLDTVIAYPLRLKFNNLSHDTYYNLTGVINHYGNLKSGHYTAIVNKAPVNGQPIKDPLVNPWWCVFDDENVTPRVKHGDVRSPENSKLYSRDVYVLCYEKM